MNTSALGHGDVQGAHVVQLYTDDASLLDVLSRFIGGTVAAGDSAIVIATSVHQKELARRLLARGLDIGSAIAKGRCFQVDAESLLKRLTVNGQLDQSGFTETIGGMLTRARKAAHCEEARIAVFGELVALLWAAGRQEEALQVEHLWNKLAKEHCFSLLCAYPIGGFDNDCHVEPFLKMCAQHSGVVPEETYMGLGSAEQRLRAIADLQQKTVALEGALKLRQSEERFRLFVDAVRDYAIFMLDPDGYVVSWNTGAQRMKGYLGAEIIGKHFSCFYPESDLRNGKPKWELEVAAKEGRFEDEGWRVRKDGSRFWANVIITAIRDEGGNLLGFGKVTRDSTDKMLAQEALRQEVMERREAEQRLKESEESLRRLSLHLLRSQDEERRRMGRELHDSLGQMLVAMKMGIDTLTLLLLDSQPARGVLDECAGLVEESLKEVRTISYLLHPPMLDEMGLKSAISWYLEGFSTRSGVPCDLYADRDFGRLKPEAELAMFRILQESLTNLHRHSGTARADIRLLSRDGAFILEIQDYGKGMHQGECCPGRAATHGVGMRSMTERMEHLGGALEVISNAGGTTVRAILATTEGLVQHVKPA